MVGFHYAIEVNLPPAFPAIATCVDPEIESTGRRGHEAVVGLAGPNDCRDEASYSSEGTWTLFG